MNDESPLASDPLIDEVRLIRREVSERFDNDSRRMCAHLQALQKQTGSRLIQKRRRPGTDRAV